MKEFTLKMMAYLLCVATGLALLNQGMKTADMYNTNKFDEVPDKIDICNMGASHSMRSFNYEDYESEYSCFNFGLSSQRHTYDAILLDCYREHLSRGSIVFIVVTYPMILGEDDYESADFLSLNERYYTFLSPERIKAYDVEIGWKMKYLPAAYFGDAWPKIKGAVKWITGQKELSDSDWDRTADMINVQRDADAAYNRHIEKWKNEKTGEVFINQEEISAIYKMIELCCEEKAIPVLITTPFLQEYIDNVEKYAPEYLVTFRELMDEISSRTGAEYYDYSADARFKSYELFENSDHLNREGARLFTNVLMEEVVGERVNGIKT